MNNDKDNNKIHKKKMIAPIICTIVIIIYYFAYFIFIIHMIGTPLAIILGIFPISIAILMIYTCLERIKEIKKGEEDDISKY